jgi:arylsulfatase A-like enzyme
MFDRLNRRDFLKMLGALPLVLLAGKEDRNGTFGRVLDGMVDVAGIAGPFQGAVKPNVLVLVFDAMSATNLSLYGYPRHNTPNFERLANRATVFHRHYAGGSFTSPGTASLLTGVYPWTHRAFHLYGTVSPDAQELNFFHQFPNETYTKLSFTHNDLVSALLHQFDADIDQLKDIADLSLYYEDFLAENVLEKDYTAALQAESVITRGPRGNEVQRPSSVLFSLFFKNWRTETQIRLKKQYEKDFPLGLPSSNGSRVLYKLEDAIDWVREQVGSYAGQQSQPFAGYFHFLPPHEPYAPRRDFRGMFKDDFIPPVKPEHFFTQGVSRLKTLPKRRLYDEYIAYADAEFGRLLDTLEEKGLLDNTILVVTADHGEMFERGILEHMTPTLYEPLIHVPLIISRPGQNQRLDVHTPTSCVDVVPTLLKTAGLPIPAGYEGEILPTFGEAGVNSDRAIFTMDAKTNSKHAPIRTGSLAMIVGDEKLIYYFGFKGHESVYEMYNLNNDPEELADLYTTQPADAKELQDRLWASFEPYNK